MVQNLKPQNVDGSYSDAQFGAVAGADCLAAYQKMASVLPDGAVVRIQPGVKFLSQPVVFTQNNISFIGSPLSTIKQASGTPTIDSLFTLSGSGAKVAGVAFDANLAGNPTGGYTGRGELLKLAGYGPTVTNCSIIGTHVKSLAAGIYILGNNALIEGIRGDGTGRAMIRGRGDKSILRDIIARNIQPSSGGIGNKVITWDGGNGEGVGAFTWLLFDGVIGQTSDNGFHELIVVDDSISAGGLVMARNLLCDYPNSTGPDVIKFVNCDVQIDGLRTFHAGDASSNASLRFQYSLSITGKRKIALKGLDLAGHVNFDDTQATDTVISGDCVIGRSLQGGVCVDDQPDGQLTIEDGATLQNFTASVVATNTAAFDAFQSMGSLNIIGASGGTPSSRRVVIQRAYLTGSPTRRIAAGQTRIGEPLSISNTRVPADGRWILDNDNLDATAIQGQSGEFLVAGNDFIIGGPRDADGWRRGALLRRRDSSSGQAAGLRCVGAGSSCQTAWVASTAYTVGTRRTNGGNVYVCTTAGTSAASGGPTGTGTGIVDGTAVWSFVATLATWAFEGQIDLQRVAASQISAASSGVNTTSKFINKLVFDSTNNRVLVAAGPNATDVWTVIDGSGTVTPT